MADPVGDTFVDGTQRPITESRGDIVQTGAAYGPGGLTFSMQVHRPADPRQDSRWSGDSTFALWEADTNGDAVTDYEIQFYIDEGSFGGSVSRPGDPAGSSLCDVAATYGSDGYSVTIDPTCLGKPASFAYRATMYYDTNPKDENADVVSDVAPNGGLSFPVTSPG
ncbi:MAG TPA: hypothetical protein VGR20_17950 [Acidimicrobiia bacterium]|nr:hypothetical protein [Acidimicrobiia bacterium]